MIEFNNIRLALGLSWNEFYLCYLIESKSEDGKCVLSRNEIGCNLGISKQAIIDLVKKLDRLGYVLNESGKLKCTDMWSRNFTDAMEFGKETLPLSNSFDKVSLPIKDDTVKKLDRPDQLTGKVSLPVESPEVKKLYQHEQEIIEQKQEKDENGKVSLPENPSGDIYINTKDNISIDSNIIIEKGCGEKQAEKKTEKEKPYNIQFDEKTGTATCKVLYEECLKYHKEHPDTYKPEMYTKFILYWSAPNKKGVPLWYQKLSAKNGTWHLPGRLSTWNSNNFNSNNTTNGTRTNKGGTGALRPTSIAEPSKRSGPGNVTHVEF